MAKLRSAQAYGIIPPEIYTQLEEMVKNRNTIVHDIKTNGLEDREGFVDSFEDGIDHLDRRQNLSNELTEINQNNLNNR